MTDPQITLALTTTLPAPDGAVDFNDHTRFELLTRPNPGQRWRRESGTGRYVPGEALIVAVQDTAVLRFSVRVLGGTWADHTLNTQLMERALSRFSYSLTDVVEGVTRTWTRCQPADIVPREETDLQYAAGSRAFDISRGRDQYLITVRCDPQPVVEAS
ncbi:hypothetical protein [Demequina flava]|uniref:hypothetical protein n=1 Tax=Demequina flava TaxID=1095025 RepID=UPI000785E1C3|nr:hypothetical protein [Demequina flava]